MPGESSGNLDEPDEPDAGAEFRESSGNLGFVHRYRILAMAARRVWGQGL